MIFESNLLSKVNSFLTKNEEMESVLPSPSQKTILENCFQELNQLYTKTSKATQQSQGDSEEVIMDSQMGQNAKIWNQSEIKKLFTHYKEYGSRWTIIAKMIEGKPQNSIKNKFNCSIRKFTRKLNKINKEAHAQFRKQIRTESVFRIIQATQLFPNMEQQMKKKSLEIRSMILLEAQKQEEAQCSQNIIDLIDSINGFNLKTRSHKNPKHKRRKDIILFEPAKQFSYTLNAGKSKKNQVSPSALSVQPCVENLSVKGDDQHFDMQDISLEDRTSSSTNLNTFFTEIDREESNFIIPLSDDLFRNENKNCYLNKVFNSKYQNIFDQDQWFHQ